MCGALLHFRAGRIAAHVKRFEFREIVKVQSPVLPASPREISGFIGTAEQSTDLHVERHPGASSRDMKKASTDDWNIRELTVDAYTVPTDFPESDGTLAWNRTTLVLVHARAADKIGMGYTYADIPNGKSD